MGNLCSIFHMRFKRLIKVIPCARKAQLMDYILLGWQTSTYKLKNSECKWFMKPQSEIVEDTGIPLSTLQSYLKQLTDEGFIERRQALYSRTTKNESFEVKKGVYISVTDKLLGLLQQNKDHHEQQANIQSENQPTKPTEDSENSSKENSSCSNISNIKGIGSLNIRGLYIRDLYSSFNNNIKFQQTTQCVDEQTLKRLVWQYETIQNFVNNSIQDEIHEDIKKLLLGTFFNLTFEHKQNLTLPKQIVAEYLFALINTEYYLPTIDNLSHRNSILAKMIREKRWRTPKGFYSHFYLGQQFKDQQVDHEQQLKQQKEAEMNPEIYTFDEQKSIELMELEAKMFEKAEIIDKLTQSIYEQTDSEIIVSIREQIQSERRELHTLWYQQTLLEQEHEMAQTLGTRKRCA